MRSRLLLACVLVAALLTAALPAGAHADVDPAGCTQDLQYDPTIPTYNSVLGLPLGGGATGTASKRPTLELQTYQRAIVAATATNPRVRVIEKKMSGTPLDREVWYSIIGTPDNIANLDAGRNDAAFWSGVREGTISTQDGLAAIPSRPAFGWVTATPHGNEPAAGEASMRLLYEMAARLDCSNARRLQNMDTFIVPVTNPDGRDLNTRTTAWGFDPNRDRGTRVNMENDGFTAAIVHYPGVFVIDAHQQPNGYFFPPNEDAVHHEVSQFAIDFIQNDIGPMLQRMFNDQSTVYQNYNVYDLFAPIYGDSVPALLDGAAGMTYEKGSSEVYGKQVYDHYLAMDATVNITSDQKARILDGWVRQWGEAREQVAECLLQPNKLVSPLHTQVFVQPDTTVCGYYFPPETSAGDTARLIRELTSVGVHVYRLNTNVNVPDVHRFGPPRAAQTVMLPAGTLYVPMDQGQKHWIQAVLGENPYLPYPYNYDVTQWSYPLTRGIAGSGFLTQPTLPPNTSMTEVTDAAYGAVTNPSSPVYAFDTDSAQALGLVTELVSRGAGVGRAASPFSAANRNFKSGAALVGGLGSIDIAALARDRETPIYGLPRYPVARYPLTKPKIGIFTTLPATTPNPIPLAGTTKGACASGYCEALFTLTQKDKIPASLISPITADDLAAGRLVKEGFTVFIYPSFAVPNNPSPANPHPVIPPGPQATALQQFVNQGGRYIGTLTLGATNARNAGLTTVNTQAIAGLNTPGSLYDAAFDTSDPLLWGFDSGGWLYRDLGAMGNGVPNFDPDTLVGSPAANIPAARVAGRYGPVQADGQMYNYGFDVNARGANQLANRPAIVDQPFGQGRALLLGFNPFYRAWLDGEERIVLNGILYPAGSAAGADAAPAEVAAAARPAAAPIARAKLPSVKSRPDRGGRSTSRDLMITVKRSQAATLRSVVKRAKLTKRLRSKVRYVATRTRVTLVMRDVRTDDPHARAAWVVRIMDGLAKRKVVPLTAQV